MSGATVKPVTISTCRAPWSARAAWSAAPGVEKAARSRRPGSRARIWSMRSAARVTSRTLSPPRLVQQALVGRQRHRGTAAAEALGVAVDQHAPRRRVDARGLGLRREIRNELDRVPVRRHARYHEHAA